MTVGLDIVMLIPGMRFQGDSLEDRSLGGSETAGLYVARELRRLGHHVTVFSNCERPGDYDGVHYLPIQQWTEYSQAVPHDVAVVQRTPEAFQAHLASRVNFLWCHDLALMRQANVFRGTLWNVDRILVVSEFMKRQYTDVYGLPDDVVEATRNGIEIARVQKIREDAEKLGTVRDRKKLICAARPERGVDVLVQQIFPKLLEKDPELRLHLCGYDNNVPHMADFYGQVDAVIKALGDRVVWLGHLPKDQLYFHYLTAGCYVYPTPSPTAPMFREVSCISAMEAMACGLPIVTSDQGALPETIASGAGTLVGGDPSSPDYQTRFVDGVLKLVHDDAAWDAASASGRARAQDLDWSGVARQWTDLFWKVLDEHNQSPHRLALHFIRRSDILAAKEAVKDLDDDLALEIKRRLAAHWSFTDKGADGYREQYEKIGQTHRPEFDAEGNQQRFHVCANWMDDRPDLKRVLDYGCAHGAYTVNFSNRFPEREFFGVDLDKHGIAWAERFRAERATHPGQLQFRLGGEDVDLSDAGPFDLLFMGETLEHLPRPWEVVDKLERWVRPGGQVLVTVPMGPWEFLSTANFHGKDPYPHRAHIWELERHDLRELFGRKKNFQIFTVPHGVEGERTGEIVGWQLITWEVDGTPCGPIDMARKLRLQRPRESVSALLIAGPGAEQTLLWALEPLQDVVDEIVIGDTGMSDLAKTMAQSYNARIIPARAPLEHGFEAPRNDALEHCRMDWVFWLDTDERLVDPVRMHKYLRASGMFNGYSIRQHHHSVDAVFKPDMPVRLFKDRKSVV